MSGPRSVHGPLNDARPPMPTGPAISGGFEPSCVDSASTAALYVVTSSLRLLPGYFVAKSAATFFSVGSCAGSSPPPRQQYQRRSTGSNSGMWNVCPAKGGNVTGLKVFLAVGSMEPDGWALVPHAAAIIAIVANAATTRGGLVSTSSSFSTQPARAGWG